MPDRSNEGPSSAALDELFARNRVWARRKVEQDPTFFSRLVHQQTPRYLWIGCSDSRITANSVLDLDPGEVFVHRNIANFVHTSDMNLLAVLEYAVGTLKVEHVIVCGHYGCGGVRRAIAEDRSDLVDHWLQPLTMLYRKHQASFDALPDEAAKLDRLCELNVEMQVRRVAATPIVEGVWKRGQKMHLHGWIYGIQDGLLRDLSPTVSSIAERDLLPTVDQHALVPMPPRVTGILHPDPRFVAAGAEAGGTDCC
jgi:carbonic anhydrase